MSFGKYADEYSKLGFNCIPVLPRTKNKPVIKWREYESKKPDIQELQDWIFNYPEHNIAIITGRISNLIVVDIDGQEGEESIKNYKIPETLEVVTSRGRHLYFRYASNINIKNYVGILKKVDIRSDGGYVIAPESTHESGHVYKFKDKNILIQDLPEFILELVKKQDKQEPKQKKQSEIEIIKQGVESGSRDSSCAKLAGHYISKNYSRPDILDLLKNWNLKNKPPLSDQDLIKTLDSIYNKSNTNNSNNFKNSPAIDLKQAKNIINSWLYYEDDSIIDVALAVAASTNSDSDSLWVILVGAASTGKTELLRAFDNHEDTYFTDNITPAAIASGFKHAKGILERFNNCKKTWIIQDFADILSKPQTDRSLIINSLRQIYNGKYYNEWGNQKKVSWSGKFNLLSGSTPDIEAHSALTADLGERFLYYRLDSNKPSTRKHMTDFTNKMIGKETQAREEIQNAIHGVLNYIKTNNISIDKIAIDSSILSIIDVLADISTSLRSPVKRNWYRQEVLEYEPLREGPARMSKAIKLLIKSVAAIRGKQVADSIDYDIVLKTCADSIQSIRRKVLKVLVDEYMANKKWLRAKDVSDRLGYLGSSSVIYRLEDLSSLGILESKFESQTSYLPITSNASKLFLLKSEIYDMIDTTGLHGFL